MPAERRVAERVRVTSSVTIPARSTARAKTAPTPFNGAGFARPAVRKDPGVDPWLSVQDGSARRPRPATASRFHLRLEEARPHPPRCLPAQRQQLANARPLISARVTIERNFRGHAARRRAARPRSESGSADCRPATASRLAPASRSTCPTPRPSTGSIQRVELAVDRPRLDRLRRAGRVVAAPLPRQAFPLELLDAVGGKLVQDERAKRPIRTLMISRSGRRFACGVRHDRGGTFPQRT